MINGYTNIDIVKALRTTHQLGARVVDEETIAIEYHSGAREHLTPSQAHCLLRNYEMLKEFGMTFRQFYTFDKVKLSY